MITLKTLQIRPIKNPTKQSARDNVMRARDAIRISDWDYDMFYDAHDKRYSFFIETTSGYVCVPTTHGLLIVGQYPEHLSLAID